MFFRLRLRLLVILILLLNGCTTLENKSDRLTPLERLTIGNKRFLKSEPKDQILKLKKGQLPYAVIVSCSDSRVTPELIFNQHLGSLFVVRTAGNIIGNYEMGSIEYAIENFQSSLIVVLGHEDCGAVTAYLKHKDGTLNGSIQDIVNYIKDEEEERILPDTLRLEDLLPFAIKANVVHGVKELYKSEIIKTKLANQKLSVVGAIYHLSDGHVEFLDN